MRLYYHIFLLLFISININSQDVLDTQKYLQQPHPKLTPEIFAPGIISLNNEYEFGSIFNKAGTEFYYGVDLNGKVEIRYCKLIESGWTSPKTILSDQDYGYNDPFLSPDENRLYFISQKALLGMGAKKDHDIWYVEKNGDTWSAPINAGPNINTANEEYYISFTNDGTMYFSSNKGNKDTDTKSFDIYYSKYIRGSFQPSVRLSDSINTKYYEADVFIDPNEDYIIFCAQRPEGFGRGDLYISFKNKNGKWSQSLNMGNVINTKGHELCPYVTEDGRYLFYTSNENIYWVSTDIFNQLKNQ